MRINDTCGPDPPSRPNHINQLPINCPGGLYVIQLYTIIHNHKNSFPNYFPICSYIHIHCACTHGSLHRESWHWPSYHSDPAGSRTWFFKFRRHSQLSSCCRTVRNGERYAGCVATLCVSATTWLPISVPFSLPTGPNSISACNYGRHFMDIELCFGREPYASSTMTLWRKKSRA